ncbi:EAL domain-containing protein [Thaumasiovibrio subtropicus]|uniref:EAL domain-containing protein n=1 Tax=Thaumasiovibrio subtropicus TaxID=1891207 RepID=UPI000B35BBCD|nr:EAL domain-containing protein [Thaumasiovibrio subtropicus]
MKYVEVDEAMVDTKTLRQQFEQFLEWKECRYVIAYGGYEIESAFQPIFDCQLNVLGFEALIRPRFQGEPVSPIDALSLFRGSGKMAFIDRLFRAMHLRNYARLPERGQYLFINYEFDSIVEMKDKEQYIQLQAQRLRELGIANTHLVLEILEHKAQSESRLAIMTQWRRAMEGVNLALDDVQDNELTWLRIHAIRPDIIKLDREELFNPNYQAFVEELKSTQATLVQEGIETEEQLALAKAAGIDWFQGFFLGHPKLISIYIDEGVTKRENYGN